MISAVQSALAGLFVYSKILDTAAHNVANSNTDSYKKSRATVGQNDLGLPKVTIAKVDTPGIVLPSPDGEGTRETSNVDIAEEMVDMITAQRGFMANLKTIQAEEELIGSLLDIVS